MNTSFIEHLTATKANPVFSGSLSLDRKTNTTTGTNSVAIGQNAEASGNYSSAIGQNVTSSGFCSFSEGVRTSARGSSSHAEGSETEATGGSSHAEGNKTTASTCAHSEGYKTSADGNSSHSEGSNTLAFGGSSHAEGSQNSVFGFYGHVEGHGNIAADDAQHVFGTYNIPIMSKNPDDNPGDVQPWESNTLYNPGDCVEYSIWYWYCTTEHTSSSTFDSSKWTKITNTDSVLEIVGNGTSNSSRSNARTLDVNGNEILAGKLTVGAGPTDNMDVATKQYVDGAIQTVDLSAYATKANPEFTGGISLGRKSGTSIGSYSSAIGENTTARYVGSHAEGSETSAEAHYSHAEGSQTTVTGTSGHAEGQQTAAVGVASHAEGSGCVAVAFGSHAEGTKCVALDGHVTGRYNIPGAGASAMWASGTVYPVGAVVKNNGHLYLCLRKHRSGQYTGSFNMQEYGEDGTTLYTVWEDLGTAVNTPYAEVVGNGTPSARSNARTLDWRGNEWLAGKLTVSTAPENNMDVTTKQYVDSAIQTAGSTYATKASPVFTGSITIGGTTITEAKLQALISLVSGGLNGTTWVINNAPTAPAQTITVTNNSGLFYYVDHVYSPQYSMIIDTYHDEARIRYVDQYGDSSAYVDLQWTDAAYKTITFTADIDTASPSVQAFLDWLHANATQQ